MEYTINLKGVQDKKIRPLSDKFKGTRKDGQKLSFTNYYMQIDDKPFFGLSGEFHFSRCSEAYWEDEIIKMKMCGINVIATYVFWIHHEEIEGQFNFEGRRDLRKFVELCAKHGMYVIVRIGPFAHGEARNGGMPDWMYGQPFEIRSLNEEFLEYVHRFYSQIAVEIEGLYYKDGGPIIAAQLDNEYMHSAAPWEMTTGISNEWLTTGQDGTEYMLRLKKIAKEVGIDVPFYTCTAWGGAPTPIDEMMPLWGGYAFWPWIFYNRTGEHPATPEYIYRYNHHNDVPATYNFKPFYKPEDMPYACCEMGGGMMCSYQYRFQLPYQSVDAMANIKIASGCNFLGYYVFRGGTNPKGEKTPFLNEGQVTKLSYDYQAAIGEYGQIRLSYKRLKPIHLFVNSFRENLCDTQTVLPEGAEEIAPENTSTLRYAVRIKGDSGFVFVNNYQDHIQTQPKVDESITLQLKNETIQIPISLAADESCILPFNMNIQGYQLKYATVQPITYIQHQDKTYYFFFVPEGMKPVYVFDHKTICPPADQMSTFSLNEGENQVEIVTLTREESQQFYQTQIGERDIVCLTEGALLVTKEHMRIENNQPNSKIYTLPHIDLGYEGEITQIENSGPFSGYEVKKQSKAMSVEVKQVGPTRYTLEFPDQLMDGIKECLLKIDYVGDIGQAFIDGEMIADHFYNGAAWEIGLSEFADRLQRNRLTIYITPIKKGSKINVDSTMAARLEMVDEVVGKIESVKLEPIYEMTLNFV